MVKLCSFTKVSLVERTETRAIYRVSIKRNLAAWLFVWHEATSEHKIPFYRYPQVIMAVTKAWWFIV